MILLLLENSVWKLRRIEYLMEYQYHGSDIAEMKG